MPVMLETPLIMVWLRRRYYLLKDQTKNSDELRFAFDGDAVCLVMPPKRIFKRAGLDAFTENEKNQPISLWMRVHLKAF